MSPREQDQISGGIGASANVELQYNNEESAPAAAAAAAVDLVVQQSSSSVSDLDKKATSPSDGVAVGFADLTYTVPLKPKKKDDPNNSLTILHSLSGSFLPGRMTALMGASGSGKSTLLDVLSGRKNSGDIRGTVTYNGRTPKPSDNRRFVGYVEQFDTLVGELTVEQMLSYTAALKLPASVTSTERTERVNEVIARLDLESCRGTIIGSALVRGISGGQAKRVNIGLAMITRPRVLFLDEPTSGLDSRTADEVIELLWDLAREGRTVVCTIHSPTGAAFGKFDDLHMLSGGKTIYDGPMSSVQGYFEGFGYKKVPEMSLPEWLVDLTSESPRHKQTAILDDNDNEDGGPVDMDAMEEAQYGERDFVVLYENSHIRRQSIVRRQSTMGSVVDTQEDLTPPSQLSKLLTLLRFRMLAHYKDGEFQGTRFGDKIVFSVLILSLYWGIGNKTDAQSIQSTAALLYFIAAICGYGAAAFVPSLTLERSLYYRELADGCYKPATYYMSKFIEEGVLATFTSLVFSLVVFFGCSLQGHFLLLFISYYLTTMLGIILAYAVAAVSPTMEFANAFLPTLVTIW
mmetsp:Transcript_26405/g.53636  ORF Transcript_26405/g.53636 Transcript_26405/m.53636 type:complete len:575 (-) Transcript_26405:3797-5521(-)